MEVKQLSLDPIRYSFIFVLILSAIIMLVLFSYQAVFSSVILLSAGFVATLTLILLVVFLFRNYLLAVKTLNQPEMKKTPVLEEKKTVKYVHSIIDKAEVMRIRGLLIQSMEQRMLYLNADLKLERLAEEISVPKHQITQVLNEHMQMNFYQFVNTYRLKEFKKRVGEDFNCDYTILAHAFDSGFQSKSSFNKIFKDKFNITPSEYRKGFVKV